MAGFDPIHALKEQLVGLADVQKVISTRARAAELRMSEAEAEYNGLVKVEGFVKQLVADTRAHLARLEEEAQR